MAALFTCALSLPVALPVRAETESARIVVKLHAGSDGSLEGGDLVGKGNELAGLRRALGARGVGHGRIARTFSRSPEVLRAERALGERRSGRRLSDLALFFTLDLPPGSDREVLVASLRALPIVESAEPWPELAPPPLDIAPPTPDFTSLQTYTDAAPVGIGSAAVAGVAGATGAGTRYVDIEYGWELAHEDLELPPSVIITSGTPDNPFMDQGSHGDAVLGIVSARANGYGVTGLVPDSAVHVAPSYTVEHGWDVGLAIEESLAALAPAGPGDLILIEQQMYVCGYDGSGGTQVGTGPVEYFSAWRDAIETATALGVTVVEAGGNGSVDLDDPSCGGAFDRALADSGAIFVAAGSASTHAPVSYSNYGGRMDVQGIAEGLTTLGGGALFGGSDVLQRYQSSFGGSSGASALVAGVALALQGMHLAAGMAPLEPLALRLLLVQTGTPQAVVPQHIGPLPDLAAAYAAAIPQPEIPVLPGQSSLGLGALLFGVVALRVRLG